MLIKCAWCGAEAPNSEEGQSFNANGNENSHRKTSHTICPVCEKEWLRSGFNHEARASSEVDGIEYRRSGKPWVLEVYNPVLSTGWEPVFELDESQLPEALELRTELNRINAPIVTRVVQKTDQTEPTDT